MTVVKTDMVKSVADKIRLSLPIYYLEQVHAL